MKYIIIICMFVLTGLSYSQCGTWDAEIISIQKIDSFYVVTGKNYMPDCSTASGIYFEWIASESVAGHLSLGIIINFDTLRVKSGYWIYRDMYVKSSQK